MIQSNKIFRAHSGCWDYASTNDLKYSKKLIFKHFFFMLNRKFDASMIFKMTHSRIFGKNYLPGTSHYSEYQKLDFHGISHFSAVLSSIILKLCGSNQEL
jgi:hypothetical protein